MLNTTALGRLGDDAKLITNVEHPFASFSLAINRSKDQDPIWVKCIYRLKENDGVVEYLKKSKMVYVSGTPAVEAYISDKSGTPEARANQLIYVYTLELAGQ